MMRRLAGVTLTLLVGAAVSGAAYWGFLSTPESTVWMLGLSALLVAGALAAAATSVNAALLLWSADIAQGADASGSAGARRGAIALARQAARGVAACAPALAVLIAVWWLTSAGEAWVAAHSGEISAWFIATAGWADVRWMFTATGWLAAWVRAVGAPLVALTWWNAALGGQWWPARAALRQAVSLKALAVVTIVVGLLVWVPWTYLVPWRPEGLPPGTGEIAFVVAKLGVAAVLMAVGVALVARAAVAGGPQATSQPAP